MRTRVLLGALALVSLVAVFTTRVSRKMPDFEVYWTAGSRAIAAEPLYRADDGHFQFKYLPAFALLVSPLAMAPLPVAKAGWFGGSAVLMVVLLWLSLTAMPARLVLLLVLPVARYGWDGNLRLHAEWWHTVTSTTAPNLLNQDNVSLSAMFAKWLGPGSQASL